MVAMGENRVVLALNLLSDASMAGIEGLTDTLRVLPEPPLQLAHTPTGIPDPLPDEKDGGDRER